MEDSITSFDETQAIDGCYNHSRDDKRGETHGESDFTSSGQKRWTRRRNQLCLKRAKALETGIKIPRLFVKEAFLYFVSCLPLSRCVILTTSEFGMALKEHPQRKKILLVQHSWNQEQASGPSSKHDQMQIKRIRHPQKRYQAILGTATQSP